LSGNFLVAAALVACTLLFGRVYCSTLCPLGVLQDLLACLGSNFLFVSVNGSWVWFFAQILSFMFTVMSFYYARCKTGSNDPYYLAPLFLACAAGCRPFQIVYAPLIACMMCGRFVSEGGTLGGFIKRLPIWCIPAAVLCCLYLTLNYLRFGSPLEFGHNYLPEFVNSKDGQFSLKYLEENIGRLLRLPYRDRNGALTFHRFDGTAFWLVSPIFLAVPFAPVIAFFKDRKTIKGRLGSALFQMAAILLIALHLLLLCLHKTMGGWHFGNRYTVDALPAALLAISAALPINGKRGRIILSACLVPFLLAGFLINAFGTVWFYTFNR